MTIQHLYATVLALLLVAPPAFALDDAGVRPTRLRQCVDLRVDTIPSRDDSLRTNVRFPELMSIPSGASAELVVTLDATAADLRGVTPGQLAARIGPYDWVQFEYFEQVVCEGDGCEDTFAAVAHQQFNEAVQLEESRLNVELGIDGNPGIGTLSACVGLRFFPNSPPPAPPMQNDDPAGRRLDATLPSTMGPPPREEQADAAAVPKSSDGSNRPNVATSDGSGCSMNVSSTSSSGLGILFFACLGSVRYARTKRRKRNQI